MSITNVKATHTISATRVGGYVHRFLQAPRSASDRDASCNLRYLSERPRTGAVVSTFRYGFNVLFDEGSDSAFVAFQTHDVPLHPWAIELAYASPALKIGTQCRVERKFIRFDSGLIIDFAGAGVHKPNIEPWNHEEAARALSHLHLIEEFLQAECQTPPAEPFQPQISAIVKRWMKDGNSVELLDLIGLGSGSTPSGDDELVGILAGLWTVRAVSSQATRQLAVLYAATHGEDLRAKTPLPSAQMILAALDGCFACPILDLLSTISGESASKVITAAEALAAQGAFSGLEILQGISDSLDGAFR